jgi:hypothetical protein
MPNVIKPADLPRGLGFIIVLWCAISSVSLSLLLVEESIVAEEVVSGFEVRSNDDGLGERARESAKRDLDSAVGK